MVELDGATHDTEEAKLYDQNRTDYFSSLGLLTIRFQNDEIFNAIDSVLTHIRSTIHQLRSPSKVEGDKGGVESTSQGAVSVRSRRRC